jgi:hypothetical protein
MSSVTRYSESNFLFIYAAGICAENIICCEGYSQFENIVYGRELQKRLDVEGIPIVVIFVHLGVVDTFTNIRTKGTLIVKWFFKQLGEGAYISVIAAAAFPDVRKSPDGFDVRWGSI